ncbi:MAG: glutamate racemase [Clostridiales bacterium]|jgi:glutamate racemase|nr:glutamate racemase [Clostridiales bacterium]
MKALPIGVFDSGSGGLTILEALERELPKEDFIYVSDSFYAPYGNRSMAYVEARVDAVTGFFLKIGVKAVVVACNTATNVGIKHLRERFNLPFFGVEPPLKPAAKTPGAGRILVLCTCLTPRQQKFKELLAAHDDGRFIIRTLPSLAARVDAVYPRVSLLDNEVAALLSEYTDIVGVVLGCTHYYYLKEMIEGYYGGRVPVYDARAGLCGRVKTRLGELSLLRDREAAGHTSFIRW